MDVCRRRPPRDPDPALGAPLDASVIMWRDLNLFGSAASLMGAQLTTTTPPTQDGN